MYSTKGASLLLLIDTNAIKYLTVDNTPDYCFLPFVKNCSLGCPDKMM